MNRWQFPVIWSSACVCQTCRNRPLRTWSTWPVLWSEFLRLSIQFRCLLNKGYSLSSMVYQNHSTWLSSDMYSRTWKVLTNRFMIVLLFSRSVLNPLDDSLPGSSVWVFPGWSGLPLPSPGDIPDPRIEPTSPASLLHCRQALYPWATGEALVIAVFHAIMFTCVLLEKAKGEVYLKVCKHHFYLYKKICNKKKIYIEGKS